MRTHSVFPLHAAATEISIKFLWLQSSNHKAHNSNNISWVIVNKAIQLKTITSAPTYYKNYVDWLPIFLLIYTNFWFGWHEIFIQNCDKTYDSSGHLDHHCHLVLLRNGHCSGGSGDGGCDGSSNSSSGDGSDDGDNRNNQLNAMAATAMTTDGDDKDEGNNTYTTINSKLWRWRQHQRTAMATTVTVTVAMMTLTTVAAAATQQQREQWLW